MCNSRNVVPALKFAFTPPELFKRPDSDEIPQTTETVPLIVSRCEKCRMVQSLDVVKPEILFDDYPFLDVPSAPETFYESFARHVANRSHLQKGDVVVDIGSGNQRLLKIFKGMGATVISVDPCRQSTEMARELGIQHYRDYFSPAVAAQILKTHGRVTAVTATFTLGAIDNLHVVASAVRHMIKPDGLLYVAESYLIDFLKGASFDHITHESISYFSLVPLDTFLRTVFLHLADVSHDESGNCMVMTIQRSDGPHVVSASVTSLLNQEKINSESLMNAFAAFSHRAEQKKQSIQAQVKTIVEQGGSVAGIGVSNRMVSYIHECGWSAQSISCVLDYNPRRIGAVVPGTDIPIVAWEKMHEDHFGALVVMGTIGSTEVSEALAAYRTAGGLIIDEP